MIPVTNEHLMSNEAIPDHIIVYGSNVHGCVKTERQVMITFTVKQDPRQQGRASFYDMFLTTEQAAKLVEDLKALR